MIEALLLRPLCFPRFLRPLLPSNATDRVLADSLPYNGTREEQGLFTVSILLGLFLERGNGTKGGLDCEEVT